MNNIGKKIIKTVSGFLIIILSCFLLETISAQEVKAQDIVITANAITEVRSLPSPDAPLLGTLGPGIYLARYEARPDGWSQIDYAGTPAYILTKSMTVYGSVPTASNSGTTTNINGAKASSGITVYVTATGSKYHNKANCGRTKSASSVPLEQAQAMGMTPCKNCFK